MKNVFILFGVIVVIIVILIQIRTPKEDVKIKFKKINLNLSNFQKIDLEKRINKISKNVIIIFSSSCEFCFNEFESLENNDYAKFPINANILCLSTDSLKNMEVFFSQFPKLIQLKNLLIVRDTLGLITTLFPKHSIPSTYILDSSNNIMNEYSGEISAAIISKSLLKVQ